MTSPIVEQVARAINDGLAYWYDVQSDPTSEHVVNVARAAIAVTLAAIREPGDEALRMGHVVEIEKWHSGHDPLQAAYEAIVDRLIKETGE